MKLAVIDYGAGNLRSVVKAFDFIGVKTLVTAEKKAIDSCDAIILPGVGAYRVAMNKLNDSGLTQIIKQSAIDGKPVFGICLGMQLLFDKSFEFGETEGFGLIKGTVGKIDVHDTSLKIPHIGWNSLEITKKSPLFESVENGSYFYFVHSFAAVTDPCNVAAYTDYGGKVVAAAASGNVCGTQFHPEKSGEAGIKILKNFCEAVQHDNFTCD